MLYISYFLKKRIEYYDRMTGNYEQWVRFFLTTIYEYSHDASRAVDELTELHEKTADTENGT